MIPASIISLQTIFGFSFGVAFTLVVVSYFVANPEKFQKWAAMIGWAVSKIWNRAEYFAITKEIQGRINSFVRAVESNTTAQFPRISVKLVARGNEKLIWEEGEAIIVMRDRKHRTRNFVHAAYFFTSEALLRKSKRHLSQAQKTSLDLYATKQILEAESKASVEQFMNDYFVPHIEGEDAIRGLIEKYVQIDRIGVFFPILIQELSYLGNKVFLSKPTTEVADEVKALIDFLEKFSQREVGDMTTQDTFIGKYTRCGIKIIASRAARERGDITPHKERVSNALNRGLENVYIIGSAQDTNREFIDAVVNSILVDYSNVQRIRDYRFSGQIKMGGQLRWVNTYLVYLHNPNAVKYLYEQRDIESLTGD